MVGPGSRVLPSAPSSGTDWERFLLPEMPALAGALHAWDARLGSLVEAYEGSPERGPFGWKPADWRWRERTDEVLSASWR